MNERSVRMKNTAFVISKQTALQRRWRGKRVRRAVTAMIMIMYLCLCFIVARSLSISHMAVMEEARSITSSDVNAERKVRTVAVGEATQAKSDAMRDNATEMEQHAGGQSLEVKAELHFHEEIPAGSSPSSNRKEAPSSNRKEAPSTSSSSFSSPQTQRDIAGTEKQQSGPGRDQKEEKKQTASSPQEKQQEAAGGEAQGEDNVLGASSMDRAPSLQEEREGGDIQSNVDASFNEQQGDTNYSVISVDGAVLEVWATKPGEGQKLTRYVCRLSPARWRGAEKDKGGGSDVHLVLPFAMQKHSIMLRRCGASRLTYTHMSRDSTTTNTTTTTINNNTTITTNNNIDDVLNDPKFEDYDLITPRVQRSHFPHFLTDYIGAMMSWEAMTEQSYDQLCAHATCPNPAHQDPYTTLKPAVLVAQRVVDKMPEDSWVRSFLALTPSSKPFGFETGEGTVFRSIVLSSRSAGAGALGRNRFFHDNGVEKVPRTSCPLNITVINREKISSPTKARFFPNEDDLSAELKKQLPGAKIHVVELMNFSFEQQASLFYESDVVVSVHGAEVTNTVFMRTNASVVELMPFLYDAQLFKDLARMIGVHHRALTADPDLKFVENCLHHYYPEDSSPDGHVASHQVLELLANVSRDFKANGGGHQGFVTGGKEAQFLHTFSRGPTRMIHACLREQHIVVDPKLVAETVSSLVQDRCLS